MIRCDYTLDCVTIKTFLSIASPKGLCSPPLSAAPAYFSSFSANKKISTVNYLNYVSSWITGVKTISSFLVKWNVSREKKSCYLLHVNSGQLRTVTIIILEEQTFSGLSLWRRRIRKSKADILFPSKRSLSLFFSCFQIKVSIQCIRKVVIALRFFHILLCYGFIPKLDT